MLNPYPSATNATFVGAIAVSLSFFIGIWSKGYMSGEVFERFEKKYLLNAITVPSIIRGISGEMEPDAYGDNNGEYSIHNIYYDTTDSYLIRTSIDKPRYREKLRLRSYGTPMGLDEKVYIEIKKKFNGYGNKRRSSLSLGAAYEFLGNGKIPGLIKKTNRQVLREIQYILEMHDLVPTLYLSYSRLAFQGRNRNSDIRITFDHNILSRREGLRLEYGAYGDRLLPDGSWLMEVKVKHSIPVWLSCLLAENRLYPTSFSKYGNEYKKTMQTELKRRHIHDENIIKDNKVQFSFGKGYVYA